jgi:hypothetical protein
MASGMIEGAVSDTESVTESATHSTIRNQSSTAIGQLYHLTGKQMTPGKTPGLKIASAIPTSASRGCYGFLLPARSAGKETDGTTV